MPMETRLWRVGRIQFRNDLIFSRQLTLYGRKRMNREENIYCLS